MIIKNNKIREVNIPYKLIYRGQLYQITNISPKFVVHEYIVKTVDGKIDIVNLNEPHPNCNPRTGNFCIPSSLRKLELNKNTIEIINNMISCFNLDDCYFTPWDEIEYKRQKVVGVWTKPKRKQMNQ